MPTRVLPLTKGYTIHVTDDQAVLVSPWDVHIPESGIRVGQRKVAAFPAKMAKPAAQVIRDIADLDFEAQTSRSDGARPFALNTLASIFQRYLEEWRNAT